VLLHDRHRSDQVIDTFPRLESPYEQYETPGTGHVCRPGAWLAKSIEVDSIRHNLVAAGKVLCHGAPGCLRNGNADADSPHEWCEQPPERTVPTMSAFTMGMKRRDHWGGGLAQSDPRHERHKGLVDVKDVESHGAKQLGNAPPRSKVDADACFGAADNERYA
jgi:hypothetical protein